MAKTILNNLFQWNGDIFADIIVPEGMDKDTLKKCIFRRCYLLEVIYPEWEIMKMFSDEWFNENLNNFQRMWNAFTMQYNPLSDYAIERTYANTEKKDSTSTSKTTDDTNTTSNRTWSESGTTENSLNGEMSESNTKNSTNTKTGSENTSTTSNNVNQVSPYNASTFVNNINDDLTATTDREWSEKDILSETDVKTGKNSENRNGSDSRSGKDNLEGNVVRDINGNIMGNSNKNENGNWKETGNRKTLQEIIREEFRNGELNIYNKIASMWEDQFCVAVY